MSQRNTKTVFVPRYDNLVQAYFQNTLGFKVTTNPKEIKGCDLVVLTGGSDVSPELYGEFYHPTTNCNYERDEDDEMIFDTAVMAGVPLVGICRGGQFIHVMMGGSLWQHSKQDHRINHVLSYGNTEYTVTSTHHQIMRGVPENTRILAEASLPGIWVESMPEEYEPVRYVDHQPQLEVVMHDDYRALSFQPHPEYVLIDNGDDTHKLFERVLNDEFNL